MMSTQIQSLKNERFIVEFDPIAGYLIKVDNDVRFPMACVPLPAGDSKIFKHKAKQRAQWIAESLTEAAKKIK